MDWFAGLLAVRQTLRRIGSRSPPRIQRRYAPLKQRVDLEDGSAGVPPATTPSRGRVLLKAPAAIGLALSAAVTRVTEDITSGAFASANLRQRKVAQNRCGSPREQR